MILDNFSTIVPFGGHELYVIDSIKRGVWTGAMSYLLPILATLLIRVERTAIRTRLRVAELGVLGLTLVLLGLLNLRTISGSTSEPSTTSPIETASGGGLLDSTKSTWGTALSSPNALSSANPDHVLAGTTV
jgi:hypothetical protein